ncbi:alanine racemase [bacterium]|nr:alanine racemase [bacterium]
MTRTNADYERIRRLLAGRRLPCAFVDLDAFDHNVGTAAAMVRGSGKTLRVATKSLRVPTLIARAIDGLGDVAGGLMTYTAEETRHLATLGHRDFLIAYPTVQTGDLSIVAQLSREGSRACLVIDDNAHLDALDAAGRAAGVMLQAVLEIDMAWRPFGDMVHLGVRRSPVRTGGDVLRLVRHAETLPNVRVTGIMAYEAQVAGMTDANPFTRAANPVKRLVKSRSIVDVAARRREIAAFLASQGVSLELFNGGGTGSLAATVLEDPITEVTAGSGFFCPHLFDYYRNTPFEPAAFFALQAVRRPAPGMVTCHGGGYVASGEIGADRLPRPWLPPGAELLSIEGAGEVQTPVLLPPGAPPIALGDPIVFRHAKAGELAEHFNTILLVRGDDIVGEAPTYRGLGFAFL